MIYKNFVWLLVPLVYGFLVYTFLLILPSFLIQLIFGVLWFWIGMKFAKLKGNSIKNFIMGNSIWLLSFLPYLWQFVLSDSPGSNTSIALISQYYMLSFGWAGSKLSSLLFNVYNPTTITILSYISMLIIFTIGFIVGKLKK